MGSSFFFNLFLFNWEIIALQYCVGFCHTSAWISHRYTCVPEKAMATHSSTLVWKIPWTEEPGRVQSMGSQRVGHLLSDFTFTFHFSLSCIGEGNRNPLQCSCLENPRDGRAWWAAIYGVIQSRTRLKQLSSSSSIHTSPPSWSSLPPPTTSHPSRLSQSTSLSSLSHTANPTGSLFYMWPFICFHAAVSICPALSFPHCVHKSVLYVCVSNCCPADRFIGTSFLDSIHIP